jgi:hypothetical protein
MSKSIEQQIQAMAFQWPDFKLTEQIDQSATWKGILAPDKASIWFAFVIATRWYWKTSH